MILWLNGALLPAAEARIDPSDRGFSLGDGVFETICARQGTPRHLPRHLARLQSGLALLGIPQPEVRFAEVMQAVLAANRLSDAVLRLTVSRGVAGITRSTDPNNRRSHAIGFWVSAGIFSIILFMVAHLGNGGENFVGIFQVGLVGAVFAFSLYRTGSLWWAVGTHAAWDWAQSYFYGTADSGNISLGRLMASHPVGSRLLSGGSDGPEGSVLGIPILLLLAVVIHFTLPRRNYFLTPDQSAPIEPPPAPPAEVTAPVL